MTVDFARMAGAALVILGCIGLILPIPILEAAQPAADIPGRHPDCAKTQNTQWAVDVELDAGGLLHGLVVDIQGVPVAQATVVVSQFDRELTRTTTDALGQFWVNGLRGGTYQIVAGSRARLIRAWTARTAPPGARQIALVIVGGNVVRGQMPFEEFFASNAVVVVGLVAAMIALPIAIHNSRYQEPASGTP